MNAYMITLCTTLGLFQLNIHAAERTHQGFEGFELILKTTKQCALMHLSEIAQRQPDAWERPCERQLIQRIDNKSASQKEIEEKIKQYAENSKCTYALAQLLVALQKNQYQISDETCKYAESGVAKIIETEITELRNKFRQSALRLMDLKATTNALQAKPERPYESFVSYKNWPYVFRKIADQ